MIDPLRHKRRRSTPFARKRKPLSQQIHFTYRALSVLVLILSISSSTGYLYVQGISSSRGYSVENLQLEYDLLMSEIGRKEQQIMEARSLQDLTESPVFQNMVPADTDSTSYISEDDLAQQ